MEQKNRSQLKKAFDKSLDLLGNQSKRTLLLFLEKEYKISFTVSRAPKVEEIESALKSILGQGANLITDELRRNLGRPPGTRAVASRHGKSIA